MPGETRLRAEVVPLAADPDGCEEELVILVPSDVSFVEPAVELVAVHVGARFPRPREIRFNLCVSLREALVNAIQYGHKEDTAKEVSLRVRYGPAVVQVELTDEGVGFDPHSVPDPTTPERLDSENGRGLFLIRHLMDEVRFNDKGNSVWMSLRRA